MTTIEEAKQFLSRVRDIINSERNTIKQINKLRDRWLSIEINLSGMPRGSTSYTAADYVADLDELQRKLLDTMKEERQAYKEILEVLSELTGNKREIMKNRYLLCMTWEAIAVDLGLTYRWVLTLHGRALHEVAEIIDRKHVNSH